MPEEELEFARRSDNLWLNQVDITGVPSQFRDVDFSKFDFQAYRSKTEKLEALAMVLDVNERKLRKIIENQSAHSRDFSRELADNK